MWFEFRKITTNGSQVSWFGVEDPNIKDLAWDGNYIWAINAPGILTKFDTSGKYPVDTIAGLLSGGWGLTYSEGYFWASDPNKDMVYKISAVTSIEDANKYSFEKSRLLQNYPNPFSRSTVINYFIGQILRDIHKQNESKYVSLGVYDRTGRLVKTLANKAQAPGHYSIVWDGRDQFGKEVTSGVYFYKLQADNYAQTKKMVVLH